MTIEGDEKYTTRFFGGFNVYRIGHIFWQEADGATGEEVSETDKRSVAHVLQSHIASDWHVRQCPGYC